MPVVPEPVPSGSPAQVSRIAFITAMYEALQLRNPFPFDLVPSSRLRDRLSRENKTRQHPIHPDGMSEFSDHLVDELIESPSSPCPAAFGG